VAYELPLIDNKTLLTATGGYLGGFTHTINLSHGCAFAASSCGAYCYAQHNAWITRGRPWGLYGFKRHVAQAYRREFARLKQPRRGGPKPLRVFMSSSTDPYQPQESRLGLTRALVAEMVRRPPDVLVLQTRSPLVTRDRDLITELAQKCELWVSVTVETDMERIPGLPKHATPLGKRIAALQVFRDAGVRTQAAVSPLLPLADTRQFARTLDPACQRVILDHYLLGDGSPDGLRTRRTNFPRLLEAAGLGDWNGLDKLWEVRRVFEEVLGPGRVLLSRDGFNAVGPEHAPRETAPLTPAGPAP
jgi:DNA repair photolyase